MAKSAFLEAVYGLFEYDTLKTVHIKSKRVGLIFRLLQLIILGYVVGYGIIYQKGYQEHDTAVSSVTSKVKGVAITCEDLNATSINNCSKEDIRVWDTSDYVVPAQENDAFFIISNSVQTRNQSQRAEGWDEDPEARTSGSTRTYACKSDADCPEYAPSRNGALNGKCNTVIERCRIYGWGPVELSAADDRAEEPGYPRHMPAVKNFTVFIKNTIFFPRFGAKFGNTGLGNNTKEYQRSCLWNRQTDRFCPVFRVEDMLTEAGIADFEADAMALGALITVQIRYDCNLDRNTETCDPEYSFTRIDRKDDPLSPGYNFRFARYAIAPNFDQVTRDLYKVYGLRFVFVVSGDAGRFNMVPLLVAFGSGLGLLGLATVIADLLVTKCLTNAQKYYDHKFEIVEEDESEELHINFKHGRSSHDAEEQRALRSSHNGNPTEKTSLIASTA
eukprot:TRINITY_DN11075_c0_g1_i4.p2 TRINITY_DN11075_c0_g1~~TRINITY_DN11075_c0_g1_i4.p2  ORF type:complete len:445 (+),score=92.90 TRINITY_DN11075_c0_g1_i4:2855-4189(+)